MAVTDGRGENARVAVLGTGIMGSAMARNLVSAGLRTAVAAVNAGHGREDVSAARLALGGHQQQES
jgi:3-hydroxyisobutyrate dehydrogenase-like beta-hydroxyacid dehydrogenase